MIEPYETGALFPVQQIHPLLGFRNFRDDDQPTRESLPVIWFHSANDSTQ